MTPGRVDWSAPRSDLDGVSLGAWLIAHRTEGTTAQLNGQLKELTGLALTHAQVENAIQRYAPRLNPQQRDTIHAHRDIPAVPRWDNPPVIEGDALVLADCQCPYQDDEFIGQCVRLAVKWGVPNLVLAGDTYDLQSLNRFSQPAVMSLGDELASVKRTLDKLRKNFERVLMITGNHEARAQKATDGKLTLRDLITDFLSAANIELSDYYHCLIGEGWAVSHPVNASAIAARTPYFLAAKLHRHVISTHNHIAGTAFDISGDYRVIDAGICADPLKLQYVQMRHNTRPAMNQGSVIIRSGYAWPLYPKWSDWAALWRLR